VIHLIFVFICAYFAANTVDIKLPSVNEQLTRNIRVKSATSAHSLHTMTTGDTPPKSAQSKKQADAAMPPDPGALNGRENVR
jgi:hypothetical protein